MLHSLSIRNYALIESLDIVFNDGFSIITGETGAGKSILLGALALVLGQRADTNVLKNKDDKCVIEASFKIAGYGMENLFETLDIEYDDASTIRRIISPNGKTRAFINETPVNLNDLKDIASRLVDIHSQHQNLILNDPEFQLRVVDIFAKNKSLVLNYSALYDNFKRVKNQLRSLTDEAEKAKAEYDFFTHNYNELHAANLQDDEQITLEAELEVLLHAEEIKASLTNIFHWLSGDGASVLTLLKDAEHSSSKIVSFYPKALEISQRLDNTYIELTDLSREIEVAANDVEYDAERISAVNQRLDLIYSLQRKHRVGDLKSLIALKNDLGERLEKIQHYDTEIDGCQKKLAQLNVGLLQLATELSEKRSAVFAEIERIVTLQLNDMGMPNACFRVDRKPTGDFTPNGNDAIRFLFSANKNVELQEIEKVASGGEISRVMLSIKSLISDSSELPTIVFDEIDSGISGDIADRMGTIIRSMAKGKQVINITHLPQVASKGEYHYLVYKIEDQSTTTTSIKLLNEEERVTEIAKMLSGRNLTEAAINNARELLKTGKK